MLRNGAVFNRIPMECSDASMRKPVTPLKIAIELERMHGDSLLNCPNRNRLERAMFSLLGPRWRSLHFDFTLRDWPNEFNFREEQEERYSNGVGQKKEPQVVRLFSVLR
jgi:hypothetical protein